jgi:hypothetical protein
MVISTLGGSDSSEDLKNSSDYRKSSASRLTKEDLMISVRSMDIFVYNTPSRPPPLPEPPPSDIGFLGNIDAIIHAVGIDTGTYIGDYIERNTSINGEKKYTSYSNTATIKDTDTIKEHDDTTTTMQLIVLYQDKYKTIRPFHLSATAPTTAPTTITVRHPLSSTVPSLSPGYSITSTDGELILLC